MFEVWWRDVAAVEAAIARVPLKRVPHLAISLQILQYAEPEVQPVLVQVAVGDGVVASVSASARHGFSKERREAVHLVAGLGVLGDAHAGATTQHRYLVKKDPGRENLTQVHLIHAELFEELAGGGFVVSAGELGENVATSGVDLLRLPVGTLLHLGAEAVVAVTGLREPCAQLNGLQAGLMKALVARDEAGLVLRKAGIMGVVAVGGEVRVGDAIRVELPVEPWAAMGPV